MNVPIVPSILALNFPPNKLNFGVSNPYSAPPKSTVRFNCPLFKSLLIIPLVYKALVRPSFDFPAHKSQSPIF